MAVTVATVQDAACNWGMVKSFYNLFANVDLTRGNAVSDAINKFMDDVLPARLEGSLNAGWSKWRTGIYKEELMKF